MKKRRMRRQVADDEAYDDSSSGAATDGDSCGKMENDVTDAQVHGSVEATSSDACSWSMNIHEHIHVNAYAFVKTR